MPYLFDPAGRAALEAFARRTTLVGLDYDGTLAPIVAQPEQAEMRIATRELLAAVSRHFPLVVMTGRSRATAQHFLRGIPALEIIGSHGLEVPGTPAARFLSRVAGWRAALERVLHGLRGVQIEDKRHSLAVHYRNAADPAAARQRIGEAAAQLPGARLLGGKMVVNVLPQEAPNKGAALLAALQRLGCPRAIYAGDDDTDEDVFAIARPEQVLTIRVGRLDASAARWYLHGQEEIDALLASLLGAVAAPGIKA